MTQSSFSAGTFTRPAPRCPPEFLCIELTSGSRSVGFGFPEDAAIMIFVIVVALLIALGAFSMYFLIRRTLLPAGEFKSVKSAIQWRRQEVTIRLAYILILGGFALFAFGVSGAVIDFQFLGGKLVTSLPGLVVIYIGYQTWTHGMRDTV